MSAHTPTSSLERIWERKRVLSVALNIPEEVVINVREGYELMPLPEGSSYLEFIFARAPGAAQRKRRCAPRALVCAWW